MTKQVKGPMTKQVPGEGPRLKRCQGSWLSRCMTKIGLSWLMLCSFETSHVIGSRVVM